MKGLARETPYLECEKTPKVANKTAPSFAYVKDKPKLEFGIPRCASQKTPKKQKTQAFYQRTRQPGFKWVGVYSARAQSWFCSQ